MKANFTFLTDKNERLSVLGSDFLRYSGNYRQWRRINGHMIIDNITST